VRVQKNDTGLKFNWNWSFERSAGVAISCGSEAISQILSRKTPARHPVVSGAVFTDGRTVLTGRVRHQQRSAVADPNQERILSNRVCIQNSISLTKTASPRILISVAA
jgi:hypothetical protein